MGEKKRGPVVHRLKTWPNFFEAVWKGLKPFEVRKNDRDFQVGDTLLLLEWVPKGNVGWVTGREIRTRVTYVLRDPQWGLKDGFVVLGLARQMKLRGAKEAA